MFGDYSHGLQIRDIGGMHMNNVVGSATGSNIAGEAAGAIFSNYLSSEIENAK